MARSLVSLVLLEMLLVEKVISLTLISNYKYWKSVSRDLTYDYSGNSRHGSLSEDYMITDRGLSPYYYNFANIMSHAFLSSNEYTISAWILNHQEGSSFDFRFYNKYDMECKAIAVMYQFATYELALIDFHDQATGSGDNLVEVDCKGWNFHTVRIYEVKQDLGNAKANIEVYLNLESLGSVSLDLSISQVSICKLDMLLIDPAVSQGLILYEIWVHLGFSSISDMSHLISTPCDCSYGCPTSPSVICLPNYGKSQNKLGDTCSSVCTNNALSCDTNKSCILKSITTCKYGLYDLASSECLLYCPGDSCVCSTTVDPSTSLNIFGCSCKVGYKSIASDPPACISNSCLTYHAAGYKYICDSTEGGYILDGNKECCICEPGYTQVLSDPLVCMNILNCIEYTQLVGSSYIYICSKCDIGYSFDSNGNCNQCDTGHIQVLDDPFTCAFVIENCMDYIYDSDGWICSKCDIGYSVDSNGDCNQCDINHVQVLDDPFTCAFVIENCIDYINNSDTCKECIEGYTLYNSGSVCIIEISFCSAYIQYVDRYLCEECNEGYRLDCDKVCDFSNKCICEDGLYLNDAKECEVCQDGCLRCDFIDENIECFECKSGYNLINSSCEPILDSQNENENDNENEENPLISNSDQIFLAIIITSISVSMISLNIHNILSVIGTIQILSYILLYNLPIPSKAVIILKGIKIINIAPNIFQYFIPNDDSLEIERFNRMDINNELFFINSGKLLTSLTIMMISILLLKILSRLTINLNDASFIKKTLRRLLGSLHWNFVIGFLIQGSLELTVSSLTNVYYVSFSDVYSIVGFIISGIALVRYIQIIILLSPLKLFSFYLTHYEQIKSNSLDIKYSVLYDNLKSDHIERLFVNILELLRRIVYGVNMILFYSSPYIQVAINSSFSIAIAYNILLLRPYKTKLNNAMSLYTEVNIFLCLTIIGAFLNEDLSSKLHDIADWAFVILLYMSIIVPALANTIAFISEIILKRHLKAIQDETTKPDNKTTIDLRA